MTPGQKIIDLLDGRKGFDYWWDDIHEETQAEIVSELDELVAEIVALPSLVARAARDAGIAGDVS